jgi:tetratricopeptide (TPR) repeat protein
MNQKRIIATCIGLACGAALLFGQAKQPKVRSQKEAEAINAMFASPDPDAQIKAAENLLNKFADSDFKGLALYVEAQAYQNKNDADNAVIYAERMLELDKTSFEAGQAMLIIGKSVALRTREFDLDKEEKLTRAEKMANQAIDVLKAAPKANPNVPDEQWDAAKKEGIANAHEILAVAAQTRKKPDVAIAEYKLAIDSPRPDPAAMVRYTSYLNTIGKYDEAAVMADKVLATPDLHPVIKDIATKEKDKAAKGKAGAPAAK